MFIRPIHVEKDGKRHAYWALVESYRTDRGPRQRVVAHLGRMDEKGRLGIREVARGKPADHQPRLFEDTEPEWVEVDAAGVRVENVFDFGGPWVGMELVRRLGLVDFLKEKMLAGREDVPWPAMALVLVLSRLCEPSSELHIAEHSYRHSSLPELVGVPAEKVNGDRLYRALDAVLPHKRELECFLKGRLGDLFNLEYDLILYDVTSTYFEGSAEGNRLAKRGYSRDHRPDCKQVCIGLVVTKCGIPLGYEVFAGNRNDSTTLQEIVTTMEARYGKADRIWVVDRGVACEENVNYLKEAGRRYIVGTPKAMLRRYERELLQGDWKAVREGLEVKLCPSPDGKEVFILCRSQDRREKEKAMHGRFEARIEKGLKAIEASCHKRKYGAVTMAKRLGKLLGRNSRAAGLFDADVKEDADGRARLEWRKVEGWREWANLSEGCYLLRSNVTEWSAEELWKAYIQLTEAEAAFRIQKSDLQIRPIWHQKEDRVLAHILVCFLAYVLWKMLGQLCLARGLGHEPRRVLEDLGKIKAVDVVMPTRQGIEIRRRYVTRPDDHQAILLQRLGFHLPSRLRKMQM